MCISLFFGLFIVFILLFYLFLCLFVNFGHPRAHLNVFWPFIMFSSAFIMCLLRFFDFFLKKCPSVNFGCLFFYQEISLCFFSGL